jgi:hypothetical protein
MNRITFTAQIKSHNAVQRYKSQQPVENHPLCYNSTHHTRLS